MNLDDVARELYGLPPDAFTEARNALAKEIAGTGNRLLAGEVRKLTRPSQAGWLANLLVRHESHDVTELLALGPKLRLALERGTRSDIRLLSDRRQKLIRALVSAAVRSASAAGHSTGSKVQRQLEETLEAAVADAVAGTALQDGKLTGPLSFVGFGEMAPTVRRNRPSEPSSGDPEPTAPRRAADRAVVDAKLSVSNAKAVFKSAQGSVEEAHRRHRQASARLRAATEELRAADYDRARTAAALEAARQRIAEAERHLKEVERQLRLGHVDPGLRRAVKPKRT